MKRFLLGLCILLLLAGCSLTPSTPSAQVQFFAMDTLMSATLYGSHSEDAATLLQQEVNRLDRLWSRTREESEIFLLNSHAGDGLSLPLSPETVGLLTAAQEATTASEGAFNPLMAPLMDAWNFTGESPRIPTDAELASLLPLTQTPTVLDMTKLEGYLPLVGQALDLGGIAKGQAAQQVTTSLLAAYPDLTGGLLALGGNITTFGEKPDGTPWTVAVKDPENPEGFLCTFPLLGSCATSGGYERYFEAGGKRYHHILDPDSGYPADSGLLSVTVVAEPTLTDAYSTALFVLGADQALNFWKTHPAAAAMELILVAEDRHIYVTQGLADGFDFLGEESGYTYEFVSR